MKFLNQLKSIFKSSNKISNNELIYPIIKGRCITGPGKPKGQDAFFISGKAFGVADGVSGWLDEGIDSGIYASNVFFYNISYVINYLNNLLEKKII